MAPLLKYIDLFAGAGGLSEGFVQAGYKPVAHVEVDKAACYTIQTRIAYSWLKSNGKEQVYNNYLHGRISRSDLYSHIPKEELKSVINTEINSDSLSNIFSEIDELANESQIDLVIGGPPCQAYSIVGRSRDKNRMKGDKRNYLYIYYAEFLKRYHPAYFVFENVTGLLSAKDENGNLHLDDMRSLFRDVGYETELKILDASKYGVLQKRKRVFLVGKHGRKSGFFPEPDKWYPQVKVAEAFADLPSLAAGEGDVQPSKVNDYSGTYLYESGIRDNGYPVTWHQARPNSEQDLEIYRIAVDLWDKKKRRLNYNELPDRLKTHRQRDSFLDRFKVVASDLETSHTVVAHIAKDGHYYIHPDITQNRSLTPREAARLQSFPDNYYFESISETPGRTPVFRQIGNAVPVLLANKIAEKLKEVW